MLDVTPLRQTTRAVAKADVHLYRPTSAVRWRNSPSHGRTNRRFEGQNPAVGAVIDYALAKKADKISLKVLGVDGTVVNELRATGVPGLHRVVWNLGRTPAPGANSVRLDICSRGFFVPIIEHVCCELGHQIASSTRSRG